MVRLYGKNFMVRLHFWNITYSVCRKTKMVLTHKLPTSWPAFTLVEILCRLLGENSHEQFYPVINTVSYNNDLCCEIAHGVKVALILFELHMPCNANMTRNPWLEVIIARDRTMITVLLLNGLSINLPYKSLYLNSRLV